MKNGGKKQRQKTWKMEMKSSGKHKRKNKRRVKNMLERCTKHVESDHRTPTPTLNIEEEPGHQVKYNYTEDVNGPRCHMMSVNHGEEEDREKMEKGQKKTKKKHIYIRE